MNREQITMRQTLKSFLSFFVGFVIAALFYVLWIQPKWVQEKTKIEQRISVAETSLEATEKESKRLREARDEAISFWETILEKAIEKWVERVGLPLVLEIKRFDRITEDKERHVNWIVDGLAIPVYRNKELVGIFSLPFDPREMPAGRGVFGPSEVDLAEPALRELKEEVKQFLLKKVEVGDQRFEIHWRLLEKGGRFHTHGVVGKNGALKFESILYFSPSDQEINEQLKEKEGRTNVAWTGEVKNGLGLKAVSWQGNVSYSWKGGRIIEKPVGKFSKLISFLPLWQIDHKNTNVKIGKKSETSRNSNKIQVTQATFMIGWSAGFKDPLKITSEKISVEISNLSTGRSSLTSVYELAGNGTVTRLLD